MEPSASREEEARTEKEAAAAAAAAAPSTPTEATSSPSVVTASSSASSSQPYYFQRRFDGTKRRHELLEKLTKNSPTKHRSAKQQSSPFSSLETTAVANGPQIPDPTVDCPTCENPRLKPSGFTQPPETHNTISDETKEERRIQRPQSQPISTKNTVDHHDDDPTSSPCTPPAPRRQPLHLETALLEASEKPQNDTVLQYYKIVYRGVVALLADDDDDDNHKSGAYLSYGEIFASAQERLVEDTSVPLQTPRRHPSPRLGSAVSSPILSQVWEHQSSPPRSATGSMSSLETHKTASTVMRFPPPHTDTDSAAAATTTPWRTLRKRIRVDRVLTGGYAMDAGDAGPESCVAADTTLKAHATTPKRGNTHPPPLPAPGGARMVLGTVPVADPLSDPNKHQQQQQQQQQHCFHHGFLYSEHGKVPIAMPLQVVPQCEHGSFRYRVIGSTPLPILTGPCGDAPRTKAVLIPGTVHEVCLRVFFVPTHGEDEPNTTSGVAFLRLTRRRGWVADRRMTHAAASRGKEPTSSFRHADTFVVTMKDITSEDSCAEDCGASLSSKNTTASVPSAVATPISATRGRHRPPRRKRGITKDVIDSTSLPRHVIGPALAQSRNHHDTSALTDTSMLMNSSNVSYHDPRAIVSPSSNISLLSDGSSSLDATNKSYGGGGGGPLTPDRSVARSVASSSSNYPSYFLMRVNAPRGLKVLDAPHFQVNNLIHGGHANHVSGSGNVSHPPNNYSPMKDGVGQTGGNQSIFQTMAGQTAMTSKISNPAVFDSITKSRKLPRGSVFEASKRMEASNAFSQGAGLIKLSDNSGWAIVPRQSELDDQYRTFSGSLAQTREGEATRAFEEVGNALVDESHSTLFLRVLTKGGISVSLPPVPTSESDVETSPTSSTTGSSAPSGVNGGLPGQILSQDSDVASSVGSSFLDAMFRTPPKKGRDSESHDSRLAHALPHRPPTVERPMSTVIPCGMCVEVERWADPSDPEHGMYKNEFARLRGGQGWIPRFSNGRPIVENVSPPEFRFGSFWFRVQDQRGIKVRLGPSRRAPSIKSEEGVYFRFECGEYLRASEIVTFFRRNDTIECFAKLYRNRHVRLHTGEGEVRSLVSLTAQAEWVQVFGDGELYLEECATEPRIERHRQGWRYNVVLDARVSVRQGPSFDSETVGVVLLGGESVLINERVTGPDDSITWLRLKDGQGWVHNYGQKGESLMIPHSLRHRVKTIGGQSGRQGRGGEEIPYNTIIARLFHSDVPGGQSPSKDRGMNNRR